MNPYFMFATGIEASCPTIHEGRTRVDQLATPAQKAVLKKLTPEAVTASTLAVYPGIAVTIVVLAYNFLGDGLRDVLDPRLRN